MRPRLIKRFIRYLSRIRLVGSTASTGITFCLFASVHIAQADSFLHPKGAVAAEQRLHFWFVIGVMAFVVVPIFVILPFVLWRYRYGQRKSAYTPYWAKSKFWETVMWAGPTVIVVVLAFALWQETHRLDPYHWHPDAVNASETAALASAPTGAVAMPASAGMAMTPSSLPVPQQAVRPSADAEKQSSEAKTRMTVPRISGDDSLLGTVSNATNNFLLRHGASDTANEIFAPMGPEALLSGAPAEPLDIEVIGYDWKWLFIYPKIGIASVNALMIPVGTPVHFVLTSDSVMQSFFIPALGSQIFAMYGMVTHLNLEAERVGKYIGRNTQYNGEGFAQQHFVVTALSPAAFSSWLDNMAKSSQNWTPATETELQKRSVVSGTPTYKDVPNVYFARIGHLSQGMQ